MATEKTAPQNPWFQPHLSKGKLIDYYDVSTYKELLKGGLATASLGLSNIFPKSDRDNLQQSIEKLIATWKEVKTDTYMELGTMYIYINHILFDASNELKNQMKKDLFGGIFNGDVTRPSKKS